MAKEEPVYRVPTVPVRMGIVTQHYLNSREITANKKYML